MPNYKPDAPPRLVYAYYHAFYGTPDGPTGRWLTWNEPLRLSKGYGNAEVAPSPDVQKAMEHNPDLFIGPGRRDNYSEFYPALGLYDCLDPKTLARQAHWALEGGLDGLLWGYMLVGENNSDKDKPLAETMYDRSFRLFLDIVKREKLPLAGGLWYDSYCWFGFSRERIAADLEYLCRTYLDNPHVLHFDGRLVIWLYATFSMHTPEDWTAICDMLARKGLRDKIFLVAGEVWVHRPGFTQQGLFDGFQAYNQGPDFLTPEGITDLARTLEADAHRNGVRFWSATLEPGFEGRVWHHPGRCVSRGLGKLYESLWQALIKTQPPMITVCSFNEWGEGTQIEPCLEYEDLYLKLTRKWADAYRKS